MAAATTDRRVLVSGGGIAGLTLAILLKERGFAPLVVEHREGPSTQGYMMDFFGSGWDVAERMGLTDALRAIRYPIERLEYVNRHGLPTLSVPIERVRDALGGRYVFLRRSDLERMLYERAVETGVDIRFGTAVEALEADEGGVDVALTASDETERFDIVCGADGVHSRIRALVFGDEEVFAYPLGGYVAAFHMERCGLDLQKAFRLHEEIDRIVGFYPLGGGAADATFVFRHADLGPVVPEERLPLLRSIWEGPGWAGEHVLEELPKSHPVLFDALTQVRMPNWHAGRIVLLGDACGCLTLLAGQGSHMAMAGAYVLASELARRETPQEAFAAYEALMKPAVMTRQLEAERFAALAIPSPKSRPWLRWLAKQLIFSRTGLKLGMNAFGAKSVLDGYP